jgi:putative ABC transport system permease protein
VRVLVRTKANPRAVAPTVREVASSIDPTQPLYQFQTLQQALSNSIAPRRFNLFLLGAFAAIALVMALVGIYGVMAYTVTQRAHEIGIRMALGAQRGDVLGMVLSQGLALTLIGVGIGIAAALGLTRLLSSLLYGVRASDPTTFALVALLLIAVALLACYIPARRAAKVDPIVALRHE